MKSSLPTWLLCGLLFIFGILTFDAKRPMGWSIVGMYFYSLPLLFRFFTRGIQVAEKGRRYTLILGTILALQTIIADLVYPDALYYKSRLLPAQNMEITVSGIPGVKGVQRIVTDDLGFRPAEDVDYNDPKPVRIFVIGGMTTEQMHLGDENTWTYLLQKKLEQRLGTSVEVINAGVVNSTSINSLAKLDRILSLGLNPDVVVFQLGGNDWVRHIKATLGGTDMLPDQYKRFAFKRSLIVRLYDRLMIRLNPPRKISEIKKFAAIKSIEDGSFFKQLRGSLFRGNAVQFRPETVSREFSEALSKISRRCKGAKLNCVFLTQPSGYQLGASRQFRASFWLTPPWSDYTLDFDSLVYLARLYNKHISDFAKSNEHLLCDIAPQLKASSDFFQDELQLTLNGARFMANTIAQCFEEHRASLSL